MKRVTTFMLIILVLSTVLAACTPAATQAPAAAQPPTPPAAAEPTKAPAPAASGPVTLELWQHDSGGKINGMKAVIAGFNKQYPNITINQTVVPYDDYQTKIA